MKIKTNTLTGADLNHSVALAVGLPSKLYRHGDEIWYNVWPGGHDVYDPAGSMAEAWPILEHHQISIIRCDDDYGTDSKGFTTSRSIPVWAATDGQHTAWSVTEHQSHEQMYQIDVADVTYGATAMEAGLRRIVERVLGDEVELP